MKTNILIVFSLIALSFISCNKKSAPADKEVISYVSGDDKEMNTAMTKARTNFGQFEKAFLENKQTDKYSGFTIKIGFPTKNGSKEHMWVSIIAFDGADYRGIVVNEPEYDADVQYGDTITIDKNLISDWTYVENSSRLTYGGYTMRIFLKTMSEDERATFEQNNGIYLAPLAE